MEEQTIELHGSPVFVRSAAVARANRAGDPVLYLHSVPTSSDDWVALLKRTGGHAPDLPGFGRSGKGGHLEYSLPAYATFVLELLDALGAARVAIAGHGWGGAIALAVALQVPGRVSRLALIDPVPPISGFTWPSIVRWWQRPLLGELVMGSVTRRWLARTLQRGAATPEAWTPERVDAVWNQFDQGTQRAILRLHRSAQAGAPDGLARAGAGLSELDRPTFIIWGERDPWLPATLAEPLAAQLPVARVERVGDAGHWPWLDRPQLIDHLAQWLTAPS